jgi:glycosyltransferase involved in cell wall biosynthesis
MHSINLDKKMCVRVSVVVITKNDPRIKHTLESLHAQTVSPYEVLIVVDSEEDIAVKLGEECLTKLPLKLIINSEAPGVGGARAKGVRER